MVAKKSKPKPEGTKVLRITFSVRVPNSVTASRVRCTAHAFAGSLAYNVTPAGLLSFPVVQKPRVEEVGKR